MDKTETRQTMKIAKAITKAIADMDDGPVSTVALLHATVYHACAAARMGRLDRKEFLDFVGNGFDCAEVIRHD